MAANDAVSELSSYGLPVKPDRGLCSTALRTSCDGLPENLWRSAHGSSGASKESEDFRPARTSKHRRAPGALYLPSANGPDARLEFRCGRSSRCRIASNSVSASDTTPCRRAASRKRSNCLRSLLADLRLDGGLSACLRLTVRLPDLRSGMNSSLVAGVWSPPFLDDTALCVGTGPSGNDHRAGR